MNIGLNSNRLGVKIFDEALSRVEQKGSVRDYQQELKDWIIRCKDDTKGFGRDVYEQLKI